MMLKKELLERQKLPLEFKIRLSLLKISEWYEHNNGKVYVAFSGGKDSTVLLHLVRSVYPEVVGVFADTGLEYPEIRDFVQRTPNIVTVRPKISFKTVLENEGYPVVSKKVAKMLRRLQNPTEKIAASNNLALTGIKRDGSKTKYFKLADKWRHLINAPFKISEKCCDIMKKDPMKEYEKLTGNRPYVGTMASDSQSRERSYLQTGCNSFSTGKSNPLSLWLEQDVWDYIHLNKLDYCAIYDMGEKRTGCIFCAFGFDKDPQRFNRLKIQHPNLHTYCMDTLGMKTILPWIDGKKEGGPYETQTR